MTRISRLLHRLVRFDWPLSSAMELALCRQCRHETVVPVRREATGPSRWWIRLRCGSCGSFREVLVTDEEALALDARLHRSAQPIADAIERLDRQRMARMADALAVALNCDLVDAQDFAAPVRRASPRRQEL